MSPLSKDPDKRARQLANLRPAPPAPLGHTRTLIHGGRAEALYRDVDAETHELIDALGDTAPVRDPDGSVPAADAAMLEVAARLLRRYRRVSGWLDLHGRISEAGEVKPAADLELRIERALAAALDALGMTPTSRAKLGLDLQRTAASAEELEAARVARERLDIRAETIESEATE